MPDNPALSFTTLYAAAVVCAAMWYGWSIVQAMRRRTEIAGWALASGYSYSRDDFDNLPVNYGWFSELQTRQECYASNVVSGKYGERSFRVFDFNLVARSNSGLKRTTASMTVLIMDAQVAFPPMRIRPERTTDRLAGAAGFDDIDFESHEFSQQFYVQCSDRKFAYDLIHPRMMEYLLEHKGPRLELAAGSVLAITGTLWTSRECERVLEFAAGFFELIPEYLMQCHST
ncbi:MAG: hypothetical protein IT209_03905 [Armatimonadetes bacterium]|nr:hypothetical protein [Armatimonadota bacterium]